MTLRFRDGATAQRRLQRGRQAHRQGHPRRAGDVHRCRGQGARRVGGRAPPPARRPLVAGSPGHGVRRQGRRRGAQDRRRGRRHHRLHTAGRQGGRHRHRAAREPGQIHRQLVRGDRQVPGVARRDRGRRSGRGQPVSRRLADPDLRRDHHRLGQVGPRRHPLLRLRGHSCRGRSGGARLARDRLGGGGADGLVGAGHRRLLDLGIAEGDRQARRPGEVYRLRIGKEAGSVGLGANLRQRRGDDRQRGVRVRRRRRSGRAAVRRRGRRIGHREQLQQQHLGGLVRRPEQAQAVRQERVRGKREGGHLPLPGAVRPRWGPATSTASRSGSSSRAVASTGR